MSDSPIYLRVKAVSEKHEVPVTTLIKEITGNTGNTPTWKKGNIRSDYLIAIANRFDITIDWLLTGEEKPTATEEKRPAKERLLKIADELNDENLAMLEAQAEFLKQRQKE